jgi:hypothetical protein
LKTSLAANTLSPIRPAGFNIPPWRLHRGQGIVPLSKPTSRGVIRRANV